MKISELSSVFILILIISGCESVLDKPKELAFADISDAYFLGISTADNDSVQRNNLVKITSSTLDSEPERVAFFDENGEVLGDEFSSVRVEDIISLSPEYTVLLGVFTFTLEDGETYSNGLLVNNNTGALFDLKDHYRPSAYNNYLGSKYHQKDNSGNIYFHTAGIKRLIFQNPEEVVVEHYLDYPVNYRGYFVDGEGNIYFQQGELLKLSTGGIIETGTKLICINGFDGKVYGFQTDTSAVLNLFKLKVIGSTLSKEVVIQSNILFESFQDGLFYYPDSAENYHLFISGLLFKKTETDYEYLPFGFVFDEGIQSIYPLEIPQGLSEEMHGFGLEDHYLWVRDHMDEGLFYALDLESISLSEATGTAEIHEYSVFQLPANLTIQDIRFTEKQVIEFSGFDLSAERRVKGFISMANGLEYWDEESSLGSVTLTRIK